MTYVRALCVLDGSTHVSSYWIKFLIIMITYQLQLFSVRPLQNPAVLCSSFSFPNHYLSFCSIHPSHVLPSPTCEIHMHKTYNSFTHYSNSYQSVSFSLHIYISKITAFTYNFLLSAQKSGYSQIRHLKACVGFQFRKQKQLQVFKAERD